VLWLQAAAVLASVAALAVALRTGAFRQPAVTRAPEAAAVVVARVDAAGALEADGESGWTPLTVGDSLTAGRRVRTGPAGAGLRVDDGRSVRLQARSRLRWDARDRLTLESGAVYVDSGRKQGSASSFEVSTPLGAVRETGTQFEVRLDANALVVRVREGRVSLVGRAPEIEVAHGTEVRLDGDRAARRAIPAHGALWSWTLELAPTFEIDGRPPHELVAWAAREAGWELRYADAESDRRARASQLRGSIRGLRPDQAVDAVMPSTGLPHRLQDGVLWIGPSGATPDAR
jgi:ferric-dicitrate binding protein FerR (iron transport regulator)